MWKKCSSISLHVAVLVRCCLFHKACCNSILECLKLFSKTCNSSGPWVLKWHIFCIHSSVEGRLGSFQLLAVINKAAMNIVEHVSLLSVGTSSGYMPRRGIARSSRSTMSNFLRNSQTDFQSVVPDCNPTSKGEVFLFLHILASICCHLSFWS